MMMLKEQFRRLNNHVEKKINKEPKLDSSTKSSSTPRSTTDSPSPASIKRHFKSSSVDLKKFQASDSNYIYETKTKNIDRVPSTYLHHLRNSLKKNEKGYYQLKTSHLNAVLDSWFTAPLPNANKLFPYLHGAISETQCEFLDMNPDEDELPCVRYLLIIKSNNVDNSLLIKSTISPDDIYLEPLISNQALINLRNYSSQITLLTKISDIIIYSEDNNMIDNMALAQELRTMQISVNSQTGRDYNTYILDYDPRALSAKYKINQDLTKLDTTTALHFTMNNWNLNYLFHERVEMWLMTSKSEIHKNFYLGNINDLHPENTHCDEFSMIINCHEGGIIPQCSMLDKIWDNLNGKVELSFINSGQVDVESITNLEIQSIVKLCKLIYHYTEVLNKKVFIHCFDGYSAFSLLVLAYEIFKTGECLATGIINYFMEYKRPLYFFKNDYDVLLQVLEKELIFNSPKRSAILEVDSVDGDSLTSSINSMKISDPNSDTQRLEDWLSNSNDKNPPARVFPHLYLGTFEHASCSVLLTKLKITQIISFGQLPIWMNDLKPDSLHIDKYFASPGAEESSAIYVYHNPTPQIKKLIHVPYLEDDGKCSIMNFFEKIYRLIKTGDIFPLNNEINLIHCRVGVSRSASFCILETMKILNVSLPRAYLYVRVRRLNIIIQPNLKIFYELLKIEQSMKKEREIDWHILCREIDFLNRRYF